MTYIVEVRYRKPADFSNKVNDEIIRALPGIYKVDRHSLSDMSTGQFHVFNFSNETVAANFARRLLASAGNLLDIKPRFQFS